MPRNARGVAPGIRYHVTQRGTNRQPVFFAVGDRKLYLRLIRENREEAGARVLARLSHLEGIFGVHARKFLLLSTPAERKSAKTA